MFPSVLVVCGTVQFRSAFEIRGVVVALEVGAHQRDCSKVRGNKHYTSLILTVVDPARLFVFTFDLSGQMSMLVDTVVA